MKLKRPLILASSSPRRQYLMKQAGFEFKVEKPEVDELFPPTLPVDQVAKYLASLKAEYFRPAMRDQIIVTADTVVILNGSILNKPRDREEAIQMLAALSGNTHRVMTGVSILTKEREESFDETSEVTFEKLSNRDVERYIHTFKPYDKAGAYGAQDSLPAGYNPCSPEEIKFLQKIHNENLIQEAVSGNNPERVVLISKIKGSYFNVMGLPIHKVHEHLENWR